MQLLLATGLDARVLKVEQGQVEAIIYGYQLGALVVPTLAPVLVWLWLERHFVNDVLVSAWRASLAPAAAAPAPQAPVAAPVAAQPAPQRGEVSSSAAAVLPSRRR